MSLNFDGATKYLERTSAPVTAVPISMSCMFNPNSAMVSGGEYCLISLQDTASINEMFVSWYDDLAGGQHIRAITQAAGVTAFEAVNATLTVGTWYHAGATFNSTSERHAYLNGTTASDVSLPGTQTPSGLSDTMIGAVKFNGTLFYGYADAKIAECGIWNAILDADEWLALASGYSPAKIRPASLVSYNRLLGTGVIDVMGAPFTEVGGPTVADHPRIFYPRRRQARRFTTAAPGAGLVGPLIRRGSLGHGALIRGGRLAP